MKHIFLLVVIFVAATGAATAQTRYKLVKAAVDKCDQQYDKDKNDAALQKCTEAADAIPHPIDVALDKCLDDKHGTMPRAECYSTAAGAWETNVTTIYPKVLKLLPAELVPLIKANQSEWLKFKDSLTKFYSTKNAKQRGSGHIAGRIIENISIWKPRALFLEDLLDEYEP